MSRTARYIIGFCVFITVVLGSIGLINYLDHGTILSESDPPSSEDGYYDDDQYGESEHFDGL